VAGKKNEWVLKADPDHVDVSTFGSPSKTYYSVGKDSLGNWTATGGNFSILPDDALTSTMHYTSGLQVYELAGDFQGIWVQADINIITDSPIEKVVRAALGLEDDDELQAISYRTKGGELRIREWDAE